MTLAALLAPTQHEVRLHFLDEGITPTLSDLWKFGESVSRWIGGPKEPLAAVLSNTSSCVAFLLGVIQCGAELSSIPAPPRGADFDWYASFVAEACRQRGASRLVVDDAYLPLLPELPGISYSSFGQVLNARGRGPTNPASFQLIQFTSGSTADPRGVVLGQDRISANVDSILTSLELEPGDGTCSWLPLSHDMGLIGMLLSAISGCSHRTQGGDVVILTPEQFLRDPGCWLAACSEFRSTITAVPNFGFEMALRRKPPVGLDLSALRVCITGAEPINAETLDRFSDAFHQAGYLDTSHCPAYGLAEATLAVTMTRPKEPWSSIDLNRDRLAAHKVQEEAGGLSFVSAGTPLEGMAFEIDGPPGEVGRISIRGSSVLDAYSDGSIAIDGDGWFHTSDLGFTKDGQLFVVGRQDDVLFVGGIKVFALDIERHVGLLAGVRPGRVIALTSATAGLTVLAEAVDDSGGDYGALVSEIRHCVVSRTGTSPRAIGIVPKGSLPMTASGKIRRRVAQESFDDHSLELRAGSTGIE
jgi:fatty-acyl-CoA synthase